MRVKEDSNSSSGGPRFLVTIVFVAVVIGLLVVMLWSNFVSEDGGNEVTIETQTNEPPALVHNYQVGELLRVGGDDVSGDDMVAQFCGNERLLHQKPDQVPCYPNVHLFKDDVVEVVGPASLFYYPYSSENKRWFWPVRGVQAGVYVESTDGWVSDEANLVSATVGERLKPNYEVGEVVKASYNFNIRSFPAGEVQYYPNGLLQYLYGGREATILEGPTLGSDGHYWCRIELETIVTNGWVPCEFKKIN